MSSFHLLEETERLSKNLRKHGVDQCVVKQETDPGNEHSLLSKDGAHECLKSARRCGGVLGFIIGCFMEMAVLGAFSVLNLWYEQTMADFSRNVVIGVFLWCFATALSAAGLCYMLRSTVETVFLSASNYPTVDEHTRGVLEQVMWAIARTVDTWFSTGCLLGMSACWSGTFVLLGMEEPIFYSVWLGMSVLGIWVLILVTTTNDREMLDDIFSQLPAQKSARSDEEVALLEPKRPDPPTIVTAVPIFL